MKRTESKEETVANEISRDNTSVNSIKTISKRDSVLAYLHSEIFVVSFCISEFCKEKNFWQSLTFFQIERRLASRLSLITLNLVICWTPFVAVAMMQLSGYGLKVNKYLSLAAMLTCKSCSVINACLYGMR